jgi:trans-2-enoyl-CoA reductase
VIEKVAGTPYLEDWHGTRVYVVVERIKAFGEMVDALRIKSEKPKDKRPTLTESGLQSAIEAIQSGKTTLADVLEKRQMSEEIMAKLIEAIEAEPTNEAPSDPNA